MSVSTENLIEINSTVLPKVKKYVVQRSKLYTDAGRNLAGELKSTFIGIFPKIKLEFAPTTSTEMTLIAGLLDNPSFTVEWFDEVSGTVKTGTFYAGDFDVSLLKKTDEIYNAFSVNIISFKKMT